MTSLLVTVVGLEPDVPKLAKEKKQGKLLTKLKRIVWTESPCRSKMEELIYAPCQDQLKSSISAVGENLSSRYSQNLSRWRKSWPKIKL